MEHGRRKGVFAANGALTEFDDSVEFSGWNRVPAVGLVWTDPLTVLLMSEQW